MEVGDRTRDIRDPVELERVVKEEAWRRFYSIRVASGDIIKHTRKEEVFFGLVVEAELRHKHGTIPFYFGRVLWSEGRSPTNQEEGWFEFNSRDWLVMSR